MTATTQVSGVEVRKAYSRPQLVKHGKVESVTLNPVHNYSGSPV